MQNKLAKPIAIASAMVIKISGHPPWNDWLLKNTVQTIHKCSPIPHRSIFGINHIWRTKRYFRGVADTLDARPSSYLAMAGHLCMQLFSQINVIFRKRFSPTRIACFRASDFWYNRALIHAPSILLYMRMCDYEWFAVMILYSFNIVLTARIIFHTIQFVSLATQAFPPHS